MGCRSSVSLENLSGFNSFTSRLCLPNIWFSGIFLLKKKLVTVHHTLLRICSGTFRTSPIVTLYVDCVESPLYFIHEQLFLNLCYSIVSQPHHPFHSHVKARELDTLYENRPSCIPNFRIRINNILSSSPLLDTQVHSRNLLNFIP